MFGAALKKLAEHCEFNDVLNDTIRDRLVCGLRSEAVQKRLLTESALILDKAIAISVSMELAAKEAHQLSSTGKPHKVSTEIKGAQSKCYRCDKTGHFAMQCWSKDVECRKCGKKGRIEHACKSKGVDKKIKHFSKKPKYKDKKRCSVHNVQTNDTATGCSSSSDEAIVYVLSVTGGAGSYWVSPLLDGKPVQMEIDIGAETTGCCC